MGKLTQLARLLGAVKKARPTYKAFGLSGKRAERLRDMLNARRRAPMVHKLPAMDPDRVKALFHKKFPDDPGEAARQADKWISDARQRVRVTGGTSGQREILRDAAADEYRYLATPHGGRKFSAGGTYYPEGSEHVAERGLEDLLAYRGEAGWFPYASVRGPQGTGLGRHESFHLIGDQMYIDPELRKSMPLLWRGVHAMKAKVKGVTGLSGSLLEELGANLAEVPRGGARALRHPLSRGVVGGQPSLEKAERLLTMTGVGPYKNHWPSIYSDRWLDRRNKYSDPRALARGNWGVDKAAERAHRLVTIGREKVIPAAVLGAAAGVGHGIGKVVGPLVRGSEEVAEPDVLPTDQGHWRGRPWMWNFER